MRPEELANEVQTIVQECMARVGPDSEGAKQYYEEGKPQLFERMDMDKLLEYFEEEFRDQINYGVMALIRLKRTRRFMAACEYLFPMIDVPAGWLARPHEGDKERKIFQDVMGNHPIEGQRSGLPTNRRSEGEPTAEDDHGDVGGRRGSDRDPEVRGDSERFGGLIARDHVPFPYPMPILQQSDRDGIELSELRRSQQSEAERSDTPTGTAEPAHSPAIP